MSTLLPNCYINRHGTYYLRTAIPKPIREILLSNRREIRKSLRTKQHKEAKRRLWVQMGYITRLFETHRPTTMTDNPHWTKEELDADNARQAERFERALAFIEAEDPKNADRYTSDDILEIADSQENALNKARKEAEDPGNTAFLHKLNEQARRLAELEAGLQKGALSPSLSTGKITIEQLFNKLIYLKKTSNTDKNWKTPKTLNDRLRSIAVIKPLFSQFAPEVRYVNDLTAEQIRAVHSALKLLPKGKKVDEVIAIAPQIRQHIDNHTMPEWDMIQSATQCKYEDPLKAFTELANQLDYLHKDYLHKITHKAGDNDGTSFAVLPSSDLNKLLTGNIYQLAKPLKSLGKSYRDWHFWIIPLAMFTGARQKELSQLLMDDIKYSEELQHWYIEITEFGDDGKTTKTKKSNRIAPVHPQLANLGFIEFIEARKAAGEKYLFSELWHGGKGQLLSEADAGKVNSWFNRAKNGKDKNGKQLYTAGYACRSGIKQDDKEGRRKVFHSFRHTLINTLRAAGVTNEHIGPITGHDTGAGVIGKYGNDVPLSVRINTMNKLVYDGVSFDHLDFETYQRRKPKTPRKARKQIKPRNINKTI